MAKKKVTEEIEVVDGTTEAAPEEVVEVVDTVEEAEEVVIIPEVETPVEEEAPVADEVIEVTEPVKEVVISKGSCECNAPINIVRNRFGKFKVCTKCGATK